MNSPLIIIGAGGHAKVLLDALNMLRANVLGLTDADTSKVGAMLLGVRVLDSDKIVFEYPTETIKLVNGLGSVRVSELRRSVFEKFKKSGYSFSKVVHPSAIVAQDVVLSEGVQVMAGAILQTGVQVGANSIINTGARVDHDCKIGDHVHVGPGVIFSGNVIIENGAHIGCGATIIQNLKIGRNALIAAGAVVVKDVAAGTKVAGVPAKEF